MTNKGILKGIASESEPFRRLLVKDARKHSAAQANGEYYFDGETMLWEGEGAEKGGQMDRSIVERLAVLCGGTIPDFISYDGDPRGLVLKIESDRLSEEDRVLCDKLGFVKDWGGDYSILLNSEIE